MSDRVDDAAQEVAREVARASGGPSTPGASDMASNSESGGSSSPSESRTAASGGGGGGSSSFNGANGGGSSSESETLIPAACLELDWSNMPALDIPNCDCRRLAVLKRAITGRSLGRRFFGCAKADEERPCKFVQWLDEAWPHRLQKSLKELCKEVDELRHLDYLSSSALFKAFDARDAAKEAAHKLEEELERTKREAESVCARCWNLANHLELNCLKLQFYARCLLGVVVILAIALLAKLLK